MSLAAPGHLLLLSFMLLWLAIAFAATVIGIRRADRGARALAEAGAVADLLAGGPAVPLVVHPDHTVEADPRLATWLGLETPLERLEQLADHAAIAPADLAALTAAVDRTLATSKPLALVIRPPGSERAFAISGAPSGPAGDRGRAALLWFIDVSEPTREMAELRGQTARLERAIDGLSALIEAAPFPMWHRGPDLSLALVNGAYVRATEALNAHDAISRGVELIETGAGVATRTSAAAARDRGQIGTRFSPAIVAGQRRMMQVVDVPIADIGVAGYAIDVQELEEVRTELALFMRAQREMLDRLSVGVAQFGADHALAFHNRHFVRLFEMEPEWLSEHPDFDRVLERMRETQRAPESRDFPRWRADRRAWFAATESVEENWLLPGGTHLRVVAQPLPDRGLLLIFEDRTEQVQLASARDTLLRVRTATFDNLFEAVGVFAADGRLNLWNNRFGELWSLGDEDLDLHPRVDALVTAIAPKLVDPARAGAIRDMVRIATNERQHRSGRLSFLDGRHFEFAAVPLPDGNALFALLDITASRQFEELLRDRNEALEEANNLKNAFVSSMSYELRVPLMSIGGFAEMLAGGHAGPLSATARDYVDAILTAVQRLSGLMQDLLDLSQSEAGSLPITMEPIGLNDVLRAAVDRAREPALGAGLTLAADIAIGDRLLSADRKRLPHAFDHLFRNAIMYTPPGGRVLVRSRVTGDAAEIVISDNGRGISPKERARVFDRFGQSSIPGASGDGADDDDRRPPSGIGLPLVRQLVEAHGGTFELLSEVGAGTSAIVRLPLLPDASLA